MEIINNKKGKVMLASLLNGTCFEYNRRAYIKTSQKVKEEDDIWQDDFILCVSLRSGECCKLREEERVCILNAKVVIENG